MMDPIEPLRAAVRVSPDNIPLRCHLAETLLKHGLADEAEQEYRDALTIKPDSNELKLGLAGVYHQAGKTSHAIVIVEELIKRRDAPPEAHLMHARLLFRNGDVAFAISEYRRAVDEDEDLADADFAAQLGLEAEEEDELSEGRLRAAGEHVQEQPDISVDRPTINFDDVGGMETLKEEIRMKIIYPLQHPEMYEAYGKSIGGGILMYGPPGCGKTHLARATAGEIGSGFISVGISDVLDMWIGNSEKNLHELFQRARRNPPCVLFFDEVDALGASRTDMRQNAGRHLINQFLAEMDGSQHSNEGVLILGATNAPWHLDAAFRRPGRFDRILFVPPPDATARAGILRILCKGKPVERPDYDQIAKKAKAFSGADLKAVVDAAIEDKLRQAMKTGKPQPMTSRDLIAAAKKVRPSTTEWFSTARNYALYSNQGGLYDDILKYLGVQ